MANDHADRTKKGGRFTAPPSRATGVTRCRAEGGRDSVLAGPNALRQRAEPVAAVNADARGCR